MHRHRSAIALALLLFAAAPAGAATAVQQQVDRLSGLLDSFLAQSFARAVPVPSPSAGVRFAFDPATGTFEREPVVLGQVYLERADAIGRGRINVSLAYQRIVLDRAFGQDAAALPGGLPIRFARNKAAVLLLSDFAAEVAAQQLVPTVTWGATDALDVSVTMPLVYTDNALHGRIAVAAVLEGGTLFQRGVSIRENEHRWGAGDLLLHAKYRLPSPAFLGLAAALGVRFPTGDLHSYRGTGTYEVQPQLVAQTPAWQPASWARFQAYANAGAVLDAGDVGASEPRWGVGLDWGVTEALTLGASFLARHPLRRVAPPGTGDVPRCAADVATCLGTNRLDVGPRPVFGLDTSRPDYYDLALGGRVGLWRDTVIGFASVVVPLSRDGVRPEPIPLVGVEATF